MEKLERFLEDKDFTLIRSLLMSQMVLKHSLVELLEALEEILIRGMFHKANTSAKLSSKEEIIWIQQFL